MANIDPSFYASVDPSLWEIYGISAPQIPAVPGVQAPVTNGIVSYNPAKISGGGTDVGIRGETALNTPPVVYASLNGGVDYEPPTAGLPAVAPVVGMAIGTLGSFIASKWGIGILTTLIGMFGIDMFYDPYDEGTPLPDFIERAIYTLIPGQQTFLGEFPAGLGDIGGVVLKRWKAGEGYFAIIRHPTARGFTTRRWAYSKKRGLWRPVRSARNIVIGAKELRIAATLGHKRRIGKRKLLQYIAHPRKMSRPYYPRRRR